MFSFFWRGSFPFLARRAPSLQSPRKRRRILPLRWRLFPEIKPISLDSLLKRFFFFFKSFEDQALPPTLCTRSFFFFSMCEKVPLFFLFKKERPRRISPPGLCAHKFSSPSLFARKKNSLFSFFFRPPLLKSLISQIRQCKTMPRRSQNYR